MFRRCTALVCTLLVISFPCLGQQQPRFSAFSNLVLVDVRVVDSNGRPVRGLEAEDFSISEEGVPQAITFFQEISIPLPPETPEARTVPPAASGTPGLRSTPEASGDQAAESIGPLAVPERRIFILFFNMGSMDLQDARFVEDAARSFLETRFTANDAAAVAVFDQSLYLVSDLTSDRDELRAAIGRLGQINPELGDTSTDDSASSDTTGAFMADQTELSLFDTNQQLFALQSLAEAFGDIPGRKSILYFTPGLTADAIENTEQMRITTDFANRHNTSFYTVDSRGLVAPSPGGGAHQGGGGGTSIFNGRASLGQVSALFASQEGLTTLADDTGGSALLDDNDLQKIFGIAQSDASHYYLLGYRIAEVPQDGRFRRIDVRTRRDDVKLSFRRGYYADKPYTALTSTEREQRFQKAIVDDVTSSDFRLNLASEFFPRGENSYQVSIVLAFDFAELERISESDRLNLEIVLLARAPDGDVTAGVRDQVEIKPNRASREPRFLYQNVLTVPAGDYELSAYVRDNRRGHLSSARASLSIPPEEGDLLTGSLVLAEGTRPTDAPSAFSIKTGQVTTLLSNPLEVGGRLLIPRIPAVFRPRESLYFHCKMLALGSQRPSRFRIALMDADGHPLVTGPWLALRPSETNPRGLECSGRTPLAGLDPGHYSLAVEIETSRGIRSVHRAFEVAAPPDLR